MEELHDATALEKMLIMKASACGQPISATFELTPTCNLQCEMCYIRLTPKRLEELGGWRSLEEWKQTALELKKMGTLFILLTGGEPLLYPHFTELYTFLRKNGFIITINTNGTLLTPEIAQVLKDSKPRRVNVTLYGASEETYRKVCHNPQGFSQCIGALQLLKDYGIDTKVNFSMIPENLQDYKAMMQIADSYGFPVVADSYMICGCNSLCQPARDINSRRLPPEEAAQVWLNQVIYEKKEQWETARKEMLACLERGEGTLQEPLGMICRAADTSCWIDFRGMMLPCDILEEYGVSLKDHSAEEAWAEIRKVRSKITPHAECQGCELHKICAVCYATAHQEKQVNGSLDYLCRMTRKKKELLC